RRADPGPPGRGRAGGGRRPGGAARRRGHAARHLGRGRHTAGRRRPGTGGLMTAPMAGPGLQFSVLGPLRVIKDGAELPMSANRGVAILACLLLNANRVISVERLVEAVWAGSAPPSAWRECAICVSGLRRRLGAGVIEPS